MANIQGTAVIRDRGQLTIPEKIRNFLEWSSPNSVVSLITVSKEELIIKPFEGKKQIDWSTIWMNINLSRSYIGKQGNLSGFITSDRNSH
jgi:bifunctional DNA-binding transcriptional regulator/antitoxin component of YhaV-PrlF toxin-antitoxin module